MREQNSDPTFTAVVAESKMVRLEFAVTALPTYFGMVHSLPPPGTVAQVGGRPVIQNREEKDSFPGAGARHAPEGSIRNFKCQMRHHQPPNVNTASSGDPAFNEAMKQ